MEVTQVVTTPVVQVHEISDDILVLVDEMGAMQDAVKAAKKTVAKYEGLRKQLVSLAAEDAPAEQPVAVVGTDYTAHITEKILRNDVINKAAIYEAVGNDTFVDLANFSITDLKKYLTPVQFEQSVATVNAGARRFTIEKNEF